MREGVVGRRRGGGEREGTGEGGGSGGECGRRVRGGRRRGGKRRGVRGAIGDMKKDMCERRVLPGKLRRDPSARGGSRAPPPR